MSGPYTNKTRVHIDGAHSAIHDGKMFTAGIKATLAQDAKLQLLISPPTGKYPHVTIKAVAELFATIDISHGITGPSGGSPVSIVNRVVGNANAPGTVIKSGTTGALITYSGGTLLSGILTSGGRGAGGSDSFNKEWVVLAGQHLLFEITSSATGNAVAFDVDFYEY